MKDARESIAAALPERHTVWKCGRVESVTAPAADTEVMIDSVGGALAKIMSRVQLT